MPLDLSTINRSNKALRESLETPDPKVEISIAKLYLVSSGDYIHHPDFLERNRSFFGAVVAVALDFSAPQSTEIINEWVDTNTNGKIEKIVDRIDPQTLLFLINAIYFKGNWQDEFDPSRDTAGHFPSVEWK